MLPLAFGFGGPWDIAILGGVLILLFGGSKLAGFGKSLGQGITEFKKATTDDEKTPAAPIVVQTPPVTVASQAEDKSVR